MSRLRRVLGAGAAAAALAASSPAAVGAQPDRPTGRISLASQTTFVGEEGTFRLRLDIERVRQPADVEVAVTVHRAVTSRSQFQRTLDGALLGRRLRPPAVAGLADLQFDPAGAVPVALPLAELGIAGEGVHPVLVQLRTTGSGEVLDQFVTYFVHVRPAAGRPALAVAWMQPIGAPPALTPDATVEPRREALERIGILGDALAGHELPLTVVPTPETLEALEAAGASEMLADLRQATTGRQVLVDSYVDVDAGTLVAAGLTAEVIEQRSQGADALESVLGVRGDARTWSTDDTPDPVTLARLRELGVDRVVAPEGSLEPVDLPLTLARPFLLEDAAGRPVDAVSVDPGLADHFTRGDDDVLAAHQLLADLAVLFFDQPGRERGVVVRPPPGWVPSADFLGTALTGIETAAVLTPVTLDQLFQRVPLQDQGRQPLVRRASDPGRRRLGVPASRISRFRESLGGMASMVGPANPDLAVLRRLLLVAQADGFDGERRRRYLDGADRRLAEQLATVTIAEEGGFRLTAREGTIPLTLVKRVPYDVRLSVMLESDKLEFIDGDGRTGQQTIPVVLDKQNNRLAVAVRARTSGAFTIRVRLVSPDGRLEVSRNRYTVRSTVVSGVGIVLSVGAGAFLLVWWARHWRTVRRDRRLVEADR